MLHKRELFTLMFGLFIIIGLLYYTYFYQPFLTDLKQFDIDIITKTSEVSLAQTQEAQLSSIQKEIDDLSVLFDDSVSDIMLSQDNITLLVYLEEILKDTSVSNTVSFDSAPIVLDYYNLQRVSVSFNTDYDSLKLILDELENSIYRNTIAMMSLEYSEVSGEYFSEEESETPDLPAGDEAESDVTVVEVIDKVKVLPYNLYVLLSVEFYYYNNPLDINKEYDFAQDEYYNNYIIPRPYEIYVPVKSSAIIDD